MKAFDSVVLRTDIPESGLKIGDVGAVVHIHSPESFEVEFVTGEGYTVAVLTLEADDLRPMEQGEILHVRTLIHS